MVFPIAGLSAGMLAQDSGRILQKGCRKKLQLLIVQERKRAFTCLLPPVFCPLAKVYSTEPSPLNSQAEPFGCCVASQEINVTPHGVAISFKSGRGTWL